MSNNRKATVKFEGGPKAGRSEILEYKGVTLPATLYVDGPPGHYDLKPNTLIYKWTYTGGPHRNIRRY